MNKRIPILLFLIICSCSNVKDLEGYWYGEVKFDDQRIPTLIKFENDKYIDFFGAVIDTTVYKRKGDKIILPDIITDDTPHEFKIKHDNHSLSALDSNSNVRVRLMKSSEENFIFDYLNDKTLTIELPLEIGIESKFGVSNPLIWPLYLTYKNDSLVANFLDTTVVVNASYYKFLRKEIKKFDEYESMQNSNSIDLIADKSIKFSDLELLKKQLRIFGFSRIKYHLKSNYYDKVNILTTKLSALNEREYAIYNTKDHPLTPPPPPISNHFSDFKGEITLVKIEENRLLVNDSVVTWNDFDTSIRQKIQANKEVPIFYTVSKNSTYTEFVQFNAIVFNAYYDARDDYLMQKYKMKFRPKYSWQTDEIMEAKKKYPLIFWQMDVLEFENLKHTF